MVAILLAAMLVPGMAQADSNLVGYFECSFDSATGKVNKEGKSISEYTTVSESDTSWGSDGADTWYLVRGHITLSNHVQVSGNVHLILGACATLVAGGGITTGENDTLSVYVQAEGDPIGKLFAGCYENGEHANICDCAGLGGSGKVTIHGGVITAVSSGLSAAIGGNRKENAGTTIIYDGIVEAHGDAGAGIGNSYDSTESEVFIYGGKVTAWGGNYSAAIGGGEKSAGGEIKAYAPSAAGIGGGNCYPGCKLIINGGSVEGSAGPGSEGFGRGWAAGEYIPTSGVLHLGEGVKVYGSDTSLDNATEIEESYNGYARYRYMKTIYTASEKEGDDASLQMHRLYNPNSGEHFFTASAGERDLLVTAGWRNEGIGWRMPKSSATPVYRLYNPNGGDHHYTASSGERAQLLTAGWKDEGIGWYSDDSKGMAILRLYNPNAKTGAHHYTTSTGEQQLLVELGWRNEGTAWYGVAS